MKGYLTFKRSMLAIGASSALLAYSQVHKIDAKVAYIKDKLETNGKQPILELSTRQSAEFPWEFNAASLDKDDWEFRRVQVKGGLFATRHLVRRDKGDKPGYLVFGAMPTAQHVVKESGVAVMSEATIGAQRGIVVCLGWVPEEATAHAIGDRMMQDDTVLLEDLYSSAKVAPSGRISDPYTNFEYELTTLDDANIPEDNLFDDSENPDMDKARQVLGEFAMPTSDTEGMAPPEPLGPTSEMYYWGKSKLPTYQGYYHVRGYLRKGEESDWLLGRVNKGHRDVSRVDIAKIAGFYRFRNPSAYEYYIDRSTDDEHAYKTLLPQPNHLTNAFAHLEPFEKDGYYTGYKRLLKYSSALAALALII